MRTGLERVLAEPRLLGLGAGARVGLFTNFTGLTADLGRNVDALLAAGVPLAALYGPEHGLLGTAQAGESEADVVDPTGLPVIDTYRRSGDELEALLGGVSHLVVDLQDVGARFYTYLWTLFDVLAAAGRLGLPVVVLDRPNPIAALGPAGPGLDPACTSGVGKASIPILTGLTIGEVARHLAGDGVDLGVVELAGWRRDAEPGAWPSPWVPPSPNIPTVHTALLYPGTCLVEGTNASEGRGTTLPFQLIGAPWVDGRLADRLRAEAHPGVLVREAAFVPQFSKHAGERCAGVHLAVREPAAVRPLELGTAVVRALAELYPGHFAFLDPYAEGRPSMIDLLWGSAALRTDPARPLPELLAASPAPDDTTRARLYP